MSILVSSMAHRFNLSVPADVHWIEGKFLVDRTGTHTEAGAAQADIAADNACGKAVSEFGKVVRATLRSTAYFDCLLQADVLLRG